MKYFVRKNTKSYILKNFKKKRWYNVKELEIVLSRKTEFKNS